MIGLVLFIVLFLLSIVQLVDSLQALLLFSSELLVESQKGAQLRLFDAKRGQLGVHAASDGAPGGAPGAASSEAGGATSVAPSTTTGAAAGSAAAGSAPAPGRSPLAQKFMSVAAQARLAAMDVNDYSTVNAQRMQGDSQPLVSSVWDPERARRRAASRGLRPAEGGAAGSPGAPHPGSGTFMPLA